jgi:hypothetical protein
MVFDLVEELLFQGVLRAHEITPLSESQIQSYRLHLLFRTSNGVPLRIVHYLLLSVDPNSPPSKTVCSKNSTYLTSFEGQQPLHTAFGGGGEIRTLVLSSLFSFHTIISK